MHFSNSEKIGFFFWPRKEKGSFSQKNITFQSVNCEFLKEYLTSQYCLMVHIRWAPTIVLHGVIT